MKAAKALLLAILLVGIMVIPTVEAKMPMDSQQEDMRNTLVEETLTDNVIRVPNNPGPGCGACECGPCYETVWTHSPIRMLGGTAVQSIAPPDQPVDSGASGNVLPEGWDCSPGLCSCNKREIIPLPGQVDRDGTPLGFIKLWMRFGAGCSMNPSE